MPSRSSTSTPSSATRRWSWSMPSWPACSRKPSERTPESRPGPRMNGSAKDAAGEVVHNRAAEQFELRIGDALCVLQYRRRDALLIIYHTEVPPPHEGRGLAARMTRAALEFARAENLRVEPRCPYTVAFLRKHREYLDLRA